MAAKKKAYIHDRTERQESLRKQLEAGGHIQQVVKNIDEMEKLDFFQVGEDGEKKEIDYKLAQATKFRLDALKTATEQRLKLVNKYLPDLKSTEHTGEGGGALQHEHWLASLD